MATSGTTPKTTAVPEYKTEGVFEELKHIQRIFGYIPQKQMKLVADRRGIGIREVHAVASFYPHFHLYPPARVEVKVCSDMSCHLNGAGSVKSALERRFQGSDPKEICIREVSCLGRCDGAPAMIINDQYFEAIAAGSAEVMVARALDGAVPRQQETLHDAIPLQTDPYGGERPYELLEKLAVQDEHQFSSLKDAYIKVLHDCALRGMGGAGFPTASKWEAVRLAQGEKKWIVCNADESEPGTIKDRYIMRHLPHLVIEGMAVAGLITGATEGILYIRHEYEEQEHILQKEIDRCRQRGYLGRNIMASGRDFELRIFVSPGGYICGEETALLEAIEGKRSEPRNKPPFPVQHGLWNQPTVINNVETFAFATAILVKGAEWWKSHGTNGAVGLKFVGVSGDVASPGVFEVPMGTTYRDLINKFAGGVPGGRKVVGFAPSGPSSGYLPESLLDLPLDWNAVAKAGSMVGSGAVVVCGEGTCMLDMALNAVTFYRNESCGKCVPCRVGSQKLVVMLSKWCEGESKPTDSVVLEELSHALRQTSICGLGQILPAPIQSVLKHFRAEVDEHLQHRRCPAGVCFGGGA